MKTIIVATDYSVAANHATRYAAALAKRMQARLILYHAFYFQETFSKILIDIPTLQELKTEHEVKLNAIKKDITQAYQIPVKCVASEEPIALALPQLVARSLADVVVMGMRHVNLFDRKVFGSIATAIFNQAAFPILLVPEKAYFSDFRVILFPYDFPAIATENKFKLLKELSFTFNAQLLLLHIDQPDIATEDEKGNLTKKYINLETALESIKHEYRFIDENDVANGISKAINQYQADLLVMVPQAHGFWDKVLNRSITSKMAFQTHIPLLTLPNPGKIH